MRERAGDREGTETLLQQAAARGNIVAPYNLAEMREEAGDREGAEALLRQAADRGDTVALHHPAQKQELLTRLWPNGLDPDGKPTTSW
ncbi:hypothetical protein [Streptomyces bobili]|uniref:hypothetical protein n=1 Tax=Streptomyces bobili TaxID=67280 RepID=UPI003809DF72